MEGHLISARELAYLFAVSKGLTLKLFTFDRFGCRDDPGYLLVARVDEYFAKVVPRSKLTVATLRSGNHHLLTVREVVAALGIKLSDLQRVEGLDVIEFPDNAGTRLYVAESLQRATIKPEEPKRATWAERSAQILGMTPDFVIKHLKTGDIPDGTDYGLLEFLATVVVHISPEDWFAERQEDPEPVLPLASIGMRRETVERRLRIWRLPYLRIGVKYCIPYETRMIIETRGGPILTPQDIQRAFGVTVDAIELMLEECKKLGDVFTSNLRNWFNYVNHYGANGADGRRWFWRINHGDQPLSIAEAACEFNTPEWMILYGVEAGSLPAVMLDVDCGGTRVLRGDVEKFIA